MRKIYLLTLLICLCALCGCNRPNMISGQVLELHVTDSSTNLVLTTSQDARIGLIIDNNTILMSDFEDIDADGLKAGDFKDVIITAKPGKKETPFSTADGRTLTASVAEHILITGILTDATYSLSDGTQLEIWRYSDSILYQFPNGDCLLQVKNPTGPANSYAGNLESFDDLGETAKQTVLSYYESRGEYYNIEEELEHAYKEYQTTQDKNTFQSHLLEQSISPASSNDKMICFLTSVTLPLSGNTVHEVRIGTVFDKETGVHIDNLDLFSCSEAELIKTILDISGVTEHTLRSEMETAFQPEYILLLPQCMEVTFPAGTLPSHESTYILALDYEGDLLSILHDWVVPDDAE